jgi:hypothetical protein
MFKDNDIELNFIRVGHKGIVVSLVQHQVKGTTLQEITILPEMETIVHYDGSLDSLIESLQSIKNAINRAVPIC